MKQVGKIMKEKKKDQQNKVMKRAKCLKRKETGVKMIMEGIMT